MDDTLFAPVNKLIQDHRILKGHLQAVVNAADAMRNGRLDDTNAAALQQALGFFHTEVPRHARIEDELLLPRMKKLLKDPSSHFAYLLEHIAKDHHEFAAMHAELAGLSEALAVRMRFNPPPADQPNPMLDRFCELAVLLQDYYRSHILVEERDIFPAVPHALTESDLRELAAEVEKA
ncbi:MAG: hemerythrin domain-containing protein [Planctomycetes bacterium]|nr:hemerythrin domain-containing protein [Planctomycetota bacterium]